MPALKEDKPETMVSLAAMTDLLASVSRAHEADILRMQRDFAQRLDRATQTARADVMAEQRRRAFDCHAEGRYEATPLVNDPHTDLSATLAEVRTNTFALKLTADDQDGYRVAGSVRLRVEGYRHSLTREFASFDAALAYYIDAAARFGGLISDFRTQVDY